MQYLLTNHLKKYYNVLKALVDGCKMLQKNKCKFIVMPCNTAHYWHKDIQKKIKIPLLSMPKEVYLHTKKTCKKNSKIGILCTEATLKTEIYGKYFTAALNAISASLTFPILTNLIALFTELFCNFLSGLINLKFLSK